MEREKDMPRLWTPKLRVEIVQANGDSKVKKCKVIDNTVEVKKEKDGGGKDNAGYYPRFTRASIVLEHRGRILRRKLKKVILPYGAEACIDFEDKTATVPTVSPAQVERLFKARVLKTAGQSVLNVKIPWYVTLLLVIILVLTAIQFLGSRGLRI